MARRIIGAAFISLDGVIQAPGGVDEDRTGGFAHGGWVAPVGDEALEDQIGALFSGDFALLLGRRTYEIFAAYWPFAPMDHPIAASFARAEKYVLTRSDMPLEWSGSHQVREIRDLAAVKSADGPDLVIQGSSTRYPQLLAHGLLDRLVLMTAPVLLGSGKRLFGDGTPPVTLKLVSQRTGSNGMNVSTYEPAGPVQHAPAGPDIVSPAEAARRERIREGTW